MVAGVVEAMQDGVPAHELTAVFVFIAVRTGNHGKELAAVVRADRGGPVIGLVRNRDHLGNDMRFTLDHGAGSRSVASLPSLRPVGSWSGSPVLMVMIAIPTERRRRETAAQ